MKKILAGVFEQTWIALSSDYLVVDTPRLFPGAYFADQTAITIPDCKFGYGRLFRNGEEIGSLQNRIGVVPENLFEVCGGDLR